MKVLVTGGAGFIGSHLVDRLIAEKHTVVVVDNLSTGRRENVHSKARFFKEDITNERRLSRLFQKEKPRIIFHLAAIPRVPISLADPIYTSEVNMMGTLHVFQAAVKARARRVVFASSSSVYGNQRTLPLREDMLASPVSPYGLQKLIGERFAKLFSELYKVPIISLRYFNVYGSRIDFQSDYSLVIGRFLKLQYKGKPLTIFGDGKQTRAFCYIHDVVEASMRAMKSKKLRGGEVINIGGAESHSIDELSKLIGGRVIHLPPRPGDIRHTKSDLTLAKKLLGWQPKTRFEDGVQKTKEWFAAAKGVQKKI